MGGLISALIQSAGNSRQQGIEEKRVQQQGEAQKIGQSFAVLEAINSNNERRDRLAADQDRERQALSLAQRDEIVAQTAWSNAKRGGSEDEIAAAMATYNAVRSNRELTGQRVMQLTQQQDRIGQQSDALAQFMANHALLTDMVQVRDTIQQLQQPQGQQDMEGENFERPAYASPTESGKGKAAMQSQAATPQASAPATAASPDRMQNQLEMIREKVSPKAVLENGQVVIPTDSPEEAAQANRGLMQLQETSGIQFNAIARDLESEGERATRKKVNEMRTADFAASDALQTAVPALRDVGVDLAQDKDGGGHLVGPGGAAASLVEMGEDQTVQGASQEKAAKAVEAIADAATKEPAAAKLAVRDLGQGISAYVEDLASHKDIARRGRGNEYTINLFGRDPDNAQRIGSAIQRIASAGGSKDALPKLSLPDPGAAVFQWTQYANENQQFSDKSRPDIAGSEPDKSKPKNDNEKLLGYLAGFADPKSGKLSVLDSRRVVAAVEHPGGFYVTKLKDDPKLREKLLNLVDPSQRAALAGAIERL